MGGKRITQAQLDFIREFHDKMHSIELAKRIGVSQRSVQRKIKEMGLSSYKKSDDLDYEPVIKPLKRRIINPCKNAHCEWAKQVDDNKYTCFRYDVDCQRACEEKSVNSDLL